jgi:hypothetical protein
LARSVDPLLAVVVLVLAGYLALGRAVRDVYPISTFAMYSAHKVDSGSRIVARTADGRIHEIDRFAGWHCPGPVSIDPAACPAEWPFYYIPYLDRAARAVLERRAGSGKERVDVVRRIWRLDGQAGPPPVHDCLLAHCQADRR